MTSSYYLAVDLGASSGRHMIGWVEDGQIKLEEMYRFENNTVEKDGRLCWDIEALFEHILAGMEACKKAGKVPATMGIDTWGVDFVLLDADGQRLGDAVAYRDDRTDGMDAEVERRVPFEEMYAATGIQKLLLNTVYQLMAVKCQQPELMQKAETFLMLPDYFNYRLTGQKKQEYTNATSTSLVNAQEKQWDRQLIEKLGYPQKLFMQLDTPGTAVGGLLPEVEQRVGFGCTVVMPASHDTASAYMGVPARDDNAVTLSSGTWSLLGVESLTPIVTKESREANFANEGGYNYRFRFLKNIMGLWMIQSIRRNLDKKYSYAQLEEMAKAEADFAAVVDVNDPAFLTPESMIEAVKQVCKKSGQPVPQSIGQVVQCVYKSLAAYYSLAIGRLCSLTGRRFTSINIVGGGSKDGYLNALTAKATGLTVYAGPGECTVIGNLLAQFLAAGIFEDLQQARNAVKASFAVKKFTAD